MFRSVCILMLNLLVVFSQPLSCKEDTHCSEGYYCETKENVCLECLRCQDLKRNPPKLATDVCIKTINMCGPCVEGFINIYRNGITGKCVLPEFLDYGSKSHYAYVWMTAAVIGLMIVATFVYVFKHTDVFRVVAYYKPVSSAVSPSETVPAVSSPRHLLKYILHYDKNNSNHK